MKAIVAIVVITTLSLSACASDPASDSRATAYGDECKATYVSSAATQIANANKSGVPGSQLEKAYAANRLAQVQLRDPRLRGYGEANALSDAQRNCN